MLSECMISTDTIHYAISSTYRTRQQPQKHTLHYMCYVFLKRLCMSQLKVTSLLFDDVL